MREMLTNRAREVERLREDASWYDTSDFSS